jgi:hypothetical protein
MGWFNRDKVNSIVPYANSGQLKPRVGAKPETHTVRDDSQNTTEAMTQRRADRDAQAKETREKLPWAAGFDGPVKIGAEYTTYHEPDSPEGSAILKDKKKSAKALKKINSPKEMAATRERGESYERAKESARKRKIKDSAPWSKGESEPSGSEAAYIQGGAKMEKRYYDNQD